MIIDNDIESVWGRNSHKFLNHTMLRGNLREYVIRHVKDPLRKILIAIAKRLPEPTKVNTLQPNSHVLLDIRDEFFKHENNPAHPEGKFPGREEMFWAAWKIFICEYDHDPYYKYRFDWVIEQIVKAREEGTWTPLPEGRPRGATWIQ